MDDELNKFWEDTLHDIRVNEYGRKERKKVVEELHPEFKEASELLKGNLFWQGIFLDCVKGNYPHGISYNNYIIYHKASKQSMELSHENVVDFTNEAVNFLRQIGIVSPEEQKYMDSKYTESLNTRREQIKDDWGSVSKNDRSRLMYINRYVNDKYGHLSQKIKDELFTLINVRYSIGLIKVEDVTYKEGKIINIAGIDADDKGVIYEKTMVFRGERNIVKEQDDPLVKKWNRDVKSYESYIKRKF